MKMMVFFTRKVKITDLKPTITELSNGKIKKMLKDKVSLISQLL